MDPQRSLDGALAGAVAAGLWIVVQPLDKRLFRSSYDDVELVGKLVTRDAAWPAIGTALHVQNGALFGAAYAQVKPFLPGPPALRGALAALAEHCVSWLAVGLVDRHHPARDELVPLAGNRRALVQVAWRHAVFGAALGALEDRLARRREAEPPPVPVSSNGHGDAEAAFAAVES
jgi:hypothetical protein